MSTYTNHKMQNKNKITSEEFLEALLVNDDATVRDFLDTEEFRQLTADSDKDRVTPLGHIVKLVVAIVTMTLCLALLPVTVSVFYMVSSFVSRQSTGALGKVERFRVRLPLLYAALSGQEQLLRALEQAGARYQQTDRDGNTVFHWLVILSDKIPEQAIHALHLLVGRVRDQKTLQTILKQKNDYQVNIAELAAKEGSFQMLKAVLNLPGVYRFVHRQGALYTRLHYDVTEYENNPADSSGRGSILHFIATSSFIDKDLTDLKDIFKIKAIKEWINIKLRCYGSLTVVVTIVMLYYTVAFLLDLVGDDHAGLIYVRAFFLNPGHVNEEFGAIITEVYTDLGQVCNVSHNVTMQRVEHILTRDKLRNLLNMFFIKLPILVISLGLIIINLIDVWRFVIVRLYSGDRSVRTSIRNLFAVDYCYDVFQRQVDMLRVTMNSVSYIMQLCVPEFLVGAADDVDPRFMNIYHVVVTVSVVANILAAILTFRRLPVVGPFILTIRYMLMDLLNFGLVFAIIFVSFGAVFMHLYVEVKNGVDPKCATNQKSPFTTLDESMYRSFVLMNGLGDSFWFGYDLTNTVSRVLYVAFTVFIVIMILNLIIGVMSNTTNVVAERKKYLMVQESLNECLTVERLLATVFCCVHPCTDNRELSMYHVEKEPELKVYIAVTEWTGATEVKQRSQSRSEDSGHDHSGDGSDPGGQRSRPQRRSRLRKSREARDSTRKVDLARLRYQMQTAHAYPHGYVSDSNDELDLAQQVRQKMDLAHAQHPQEDIELDDLVRKNNGSRDVTLKADDLTVLSKPGPVSTPSGTPVSPRSGEKAPDIREPIREDHTTRSRDDPSDRSRDDKYTPRSRQDELRARSRDDPRRSPRPERSPQVRRSTFDRLTDSDWEAFYKEKERNGELNDSARVTPPYEDDVTHQAKQGDVTVTEVGEPGGPGSESFSTRGSAGDSGVEQHDATSRQSDVTPPEHDVTNHDVTPRHRRDVTDRRTDVTPTRRRDVAGHHTKNSPHHGRDVTASPAPADPDVVKDNGYGTIDSNNQRNNNNTTPKPRRDRRRPPVTSQAGDDVPDSDDSFRRRRGVRTVDVESDTESYVVKDWCVIEMAAH